MSLTEFSGIIIRDFPFPPTVNQTVRMAPTRSGMRLCRSKKADDYRITCARYYKKNEEYFKTVSEQLKAFIAEGFVLRVSAHFVFKHNEVYSKKGDIKKCDSSNRLKSFHDKLSEMLEIDDKYFFDGTFEKVVGEDNKVIFKIETFLPKNEGQVEL